MTSKNTEKQQALNPLEIDCDFEKDGKNMKDFKQKIIDPKDSTFHFGIRKIINRKKNSYTEFLCGSNSSHTRNNRPSKLEKYYSNKKQLSQEKFVNCLVEEVEDYVPKDELGSLDDKKKKRVDCIEKKLEDSKNISAYFFSRETKKECHCKHCEYVTMTKSDYWEHLKIHIEENLRWDCPLCKFITENKYHLMYHFREHVGSVPTKSLEFVKYFLDKSDLSSKIKSPTEQLRNARKRQNSLRLEKLQFIV